MQRFAFTNADPPTPTCVCTLAQAGLLGTAMGVMTYVMLYSYGLRLAFEYMHVCVALARWRGGVLCLARCCPGLRAAI